MLIEGILKGIDVITSEQKTFFKLRIPVMTSCNYAMFMTPWENCGEESNWLTSAYPKLCCCFKTNGCQLLFVSGLSFQTLIITSAHFLNRVIDTKCWQSALHKSKTSHDRTFFNYEQNVFTVYCGVWMVPLWGCKSPTECAY